MAHICLHLGLGSFHRAHQAYCFSKLLTQGEQDFVLHAGNIRDDAERTVQGLLKQDLSYTLLTIYLQGTEQYHTIKAFSKVIPYEKGLKPLIAEGANPDTVLISFTVTEAGYYLDNDLKLMQDDPAIAADLKGGVATIYGVIAAILQERMDHNLDPVTLMCCDNVRENGRKFRTGLKEFLSLRGATALLQYVEDHTSCPNTMVDRITPRPEPSLSAQVLAATGVQDEVPVMAEEFFQWVIEDNFIAPRPKFELGGAQMVAHVEAYEDAKLRILNATHTLMALTGVIKGYHYVYECARDSFIHTLAFNYVTNSVIPCIQGNGIDLEDYRDTVLERFKNDHLKDTLERIAQDSFSKMINFVKPTLLDCYVKGVNPAGVVLIAALYFNFLRLMHEGLEFDYRDAGFDKAWADGVFCSANALEAYANTELLFGNLTRNEKFKQDLAEQYAFVRTIK